MPNILDISEELFQDYTKISLSGEVDIYTSQDLKDKLYSIIDSRKLDIKIDCSGLDYIDSTGLGIFVGALKRAKQYDKKIYILNLKSNIRKLFMITGLDKVFVIGE
jgi:anti-sigma B factor antagonist